MQTDKLQIDLKRAKEMKYASKYDEMEVEMESKIERLAKYTPKGTLLPQKRSIYETKKRLIRAGGPSTNLREDPK